uniref:Uncharacterized protein n=1 Tax=Arion vulgaris TaxID=1028688 RepID=A0A0B7AZA4_9EUPU
MRNIGECSVKLFVFDQWHMMGDVVNIPTLATFTSPCFSMTHLKLGGPESR